MLSNSHRTVELDIQKRQSSDSKLKNHTYHLDVLCKLRVPLVHILEVLQQILTVLNNWMPIHQQTNSPQNDNIPESPSVVMTENGYILNSPEFQ